MAEKIARTEQSSRLETKHLLLAFLLNSHHDVKRLLEEAGADLSATEVRSEPAPQPLSMLHRATINYRRCLDDARLVAGDTGFGFVEEEHLLFALLLSPSREIDRVLQSFKTSRDRLLDVFTAAYTWSRDVEQTICDTS
jgi:ATP-dependent Clp protease ATP-binding subunit ClpA